MQLLEKEHSGCAALLRDDKVAPLAGWAGWLGTLAGRGLLPVIATQPRTCQHPVGRAPRLDCIGNTRLATARTPC